MEEITLGAKLLNGFLKLMVFGLISIIALIAVSLLLAAFGFL